MDKLIIQGPATLKGEVEASSSKNASLPILAACLLSDKPITFTKLPQLRDTRTLLKLLSNLGAVIEENSDKTKTIINCSHITSFEANYDLVKTMRASILVLGPLLSRFHRAVVSLPGGCAIGARPIDIHLSGLEKMGAKINLTGGYVEATTDGPLKGATIVLSFPSVGATENLMMAASLAEGTTVIENAAREPEIDDLAHFINQMGGIVEGAGTPRIVIKGVKELKPINYQVIGDRIEAATYIMAALITKSEITVKNVIPEHLISVLDCLEKMGAQFEKGKNFIKVLKCTQLRGTTVDTAPFPGFPTDAQAQLMALMSATSSPSVISEHIFENRFMHVPELQRMGADIVLKGNSAFINSQLSSERPVKITGAPVMCTDLRASAALILMALAAQGESVIQRVYHLDRGYENLDHKFKKLGVNIERRNDGD